jgi:hypothetical protein
MLAGTHKKKRKNCFIALLHARTYGNNLSSICMSSALKFYLQEKEMFPE